MRHKRFFFYTPIMLRTLLSFVSTRPRLLFSLGLISGLTCIFILMMHLSRKAPNLPAQHPEQSVTETQAEPLRTDWPEEINTVEPSQALKGRLGRGETLSRLLSRLGVSTADTYAAINGLKASDLLDLKRIRQGQEVTVHIQADRLVSLDIPLDATRRAFVKRNHKGAFRALATHTRLATKTISIQGRVQQSLYEDARLAGARDADIIDFANIFAFDIDFQRDIHPGDRFELLVETLVDERGTYVESGHLLFAALEGLATEKAYYRFTPRDDKKARYFQANGESARRFLMKTPLNGARLSSRFGKRRHPISGYTRLHKGTDFAAPTGTPVYAAGHGTIERASRYGGYGHYIRIRHDNGFKTAYAHLSRYARGMGRGVRVRQGQTIGYVGSTGASTGPHLHYEVYRNGRPIDVMRLNLPTGRKLSQTPEIMSAFEKVRQQIDALRKPSDPAPENAGPAPDSAP